MRKFSKDRNNYTIGKLIVILVCLVSFSMMAQQWVFPISVTDGAQTKILRIGIDPNGTDGFDLGLDTLAPPPPPPGAFDARLVFPWPSGENYFVDIRDNSLTEKSYYMKYLASTGNGPIVLHWDNTAIPALGSFMIVDNITGGLDSLDMATVDSLEITSPFFLQNLRIKVTPNPAPDTTVSKRLKALLDGGQEVPPVTTSGSGWGTFSLNGDSTALTYEVTVQNLMGNITAAHFHNAAQGSNGGVVKTIHSGGTTTGDTTFVGVWTSSDSEPLTPAMVEELCAGNLYINVHTDQFPAGEVRGQIRDDAAKLLLSEIVARPTGAEYIEIYNPGADTVDLSDYYLANSTFQGGNVYYYQLVEGGGGGGGFADFNARFPDGAMILAGEYQTVALQGDVSFFAAYNVLPTYELYDDGGGDPSVQVMREATPGSINGQGGLTNGDEDVVLYYWNGLSDLVLDVDYLIYDEGDMGINEQVDKTGVSMDGPDANTDSSLYRDDTDINSQVPAPINNTADGFSSHRIDYSEGTQVASGGNGVTGADETSENLDVTWTDNSIPTPNGPHQPVPQPLNPPRNLQATAGADFVDLMWDPPLGPNEAELFYDDGTPEGNLSIGETAEGDLAVRFTPNVYPSTIMFIKVYFGSASATSATSIDWTIWDGTSTGPVNSLGTGNQAVNRDMWDFIDVSGAGVQITQDDFFISYFEPNGQTMNLAWDTNQPSANRSWVNAPGLGLPWQTIGTIGASFDNNLLIRAIVREGSGPNARLVEITPAGERTPLTISEIKLLMQQGQYRGNQQTTGAVNLDGTLPAAGNDETIQIDPTLRKVYGVSGLLGYNIYRSTDGVSFSNIASVDSTTLNYTDSGLQPGSYWYYVTANYTGGESDPSDTVMATITAVSQQLATHETPEFKTAVTNEGTIGMLDVFGGLPGFEWPLGSNQLFEGAIMVGVAPDQVSDGARVIVGGNQNVLDEDFQFLTNIDTLVFTTDETSYQSRYDDSRASLPPLADDGPNTPIPVEVVQTSYSFTDADNSGYLIIKFDVTNTGSSTLNNVLVGEYFDWDINSFATNTGAVQINDVIVPGVNNGSPFPAEFAMVWDNNNPNPVLGAVPLSQNVFQASRVADNNDEIFPGGLSPLSEANKYDYMLNRRANDPWGDPFGPNDKSLIFGVGGVNHGFSIPGGGSITVGMAIVGGSDVADFVQNGTAAMTKWVSMGNTMDILVVGIEDELAGNLPTTFDIQQNYPNPFNPSTTIKYQLPQSSDVRLEIFNVLGQQVRTLVKERVEAGYHSVVWDGRDNVGTQVSSGVYIYRFTAGDFVKSGKMILMK